MHPLAVNPPEPLSQREENLLAQLEQVIETNMKGFVLVGMALAQIRDERLYRIEYPTFEEYLLRVWDMAAKTAYRLMAATKVYKSLEEGLTVENVTNWSQNENVRHGAQIEIILPQNEAQARPLALLPEEEQLPVWLYILDQASNRKCAITANFIIQCLLERQQEKIKKNVNKTREHASKSTELPAIVKQSFQALLDVVHLQNDTQWQQVGRKTIVALLEDLLEGLKN